MLKTWKLKFFFGSQKTGFEEWSRKDSKKQEKKRIKRGEKEDKEKKRKKKEKEKKGKIWEAMGEDSASTTIDSSSIGFKLLKKHG